jgi:hypothetical protein
MTRPGTHLRALAGRLCTAQMLQRYVDPAIADLQHEHAEAMSRGGPWRARCTRIGGTIRAVQVIAVVSVWNAVEWWQSESRPLVSLTVATTLTVAAVLTVTLTALQLSRFPQFIADAHVSRALLALYLLPSTVIVVLPFAFALALAWVARHRVLDTRMIVIAALLSLVSLAVVDRILPTANQAFRIALLGKSNVAPGLNEMPLATLHRLMRDNPHAGRAAYAFHSRLAIAVTPLGMLLFANAVSRRRAAARTLLVIATSLAYVGWSMGIHDGDEWLVAWPVALLVWAPNLTIAAVSLLAAPRTTRTIRTT